MGGYIYSDRQLKLRLIASALLTPPVFVYSARAVWCTGHCRGVDQFIASFSAYSLFYAFFILQLVGWLLYRGRRGRDSWRPLIAGVTSVLFLHCLWNLLWPVFYLPVKKFFF